MGTRKILHMDLDAFFCSVEELKDPSLIGKSFAVGGAPDGRGVVSTCSYAARKYGVHSAMPTGQALRLCPELLLVHGHYSEYTLYSQRVMDILQQISPLVEVVSIDEAFVDVSDLPQSLELIARQIQQRIFTETELPCSIGGGTSKLIAKIATDTGKARSRTGLAPRAITIVTPGKEDEFLSPLSVQAIWGVGPKMTAHLNEAGLEKIADIQKMSLGELKELVGNSAGYLHDASHGIDASPVVVEHGIKSISQETTFGEDIIDLKELEKTLGWLTEKVARRLREGQLCGNTVRIKIRLKDFSTFTRQVHLETSTDVESIILQNVLDLFHGFHRPGHQIRLLGVGVSGLGKSWHQMGLWESKTEKEIRLHEAMDTLQQRFGKQSIQRGKTKRE